MARAAAELARGQLHRVSDIPRTRFNGVVSPHRVFDAINVPLEDMKKAMDVVAQIGGPPEYIRDNWDRLVGTAQHLAELKAGA